MHFLLLSSFLFKESLELLGHRAVTCGLNESCDFRIDVDHTDLKDVLRQIPGGTDFDFIVVVERLGAKRVFPKGIEESPIPTVFYSIDTHLNFFWQREYAHAFDFVFTTQKDYVRKFKKHGIERVFWLPWSIDTSIFKDHGLKRTYDMVFVGTLNPTHRRKRSYLIEELSKRFSLHLFGTQPDRRLSPSQMAKAYSQAKIVLNESIFQEVNFRVFEAMACGPLLMTERIGNGLLKLFQHRKHLVVFDHANFIDLAEYYLKSSEEREAIADSGKQIVRRKHSHVARARELVEILQNHIDRRYHKRNKMINLSLGKAYYLAGLRLSSQKNEMLKRAESLFRKTIQNEADDWGPYLYLGMAWANREEWEKAEGNYLKSISKKPDLFHSHVLLANVYACQGRLKEAEKQYLIAGECAPNLSKSLRHRLERTAEQDVKGAKFHFYLGKMYEKNGMTIEPGFLKDQPDPAASSASEYYTKSMNIDPTYPAPWMALGDLLFRQKFYDTAIPIYEQVIHLLPQNAKIRDRLGLCYAYCYKREEARRELFKSHYLTPRSGRKSSPESWTLSPQEKSDALLDLGHSFYGLNLFDKARKFYRKALEYDPDNAETYAYLGITYIRLGYAALARWNLEKSLNLEPENIHVLRLFGKVKRGDAEYGRR